MERRALKNREIQDNLNVPSAHQIQARGLPPTNPRSADHYMNKKNRLMNQLAPNSERGSDVSTRVSSKQSAVRYRALNYNSNQENAGIHSSNTPAGRDRSKASDLLPNIPLPPLKSARRHQSQVMDPPYNYDEYIIASQQKIQSSRYGNRKNHVSEGMSIALGGFRYENASNAVRLARNESKENIIYTPRSELQARGPRPQDYRRVPSIDIYNQGPSIYQRIV